MRSPRKRIVIIALATIFVALVLVAFVFKSPPEPSYKGEPLSAWLDGLVWQFPSPPPKHNFMELREALHAMGPKTIPFIIRKLNQNDSPWRNKYRERWPNLPPFLKSHLPNPNNRSFEARTAEMAFNCIGSNALPYLLPKMHDSNPAVREAVMNPVFEMYLAGHSTNETVALFIPVLKDPDPMVRMQVVLALAEVGPAASNAIPALIKNLQSDEAGRHDSNNERVYVRANTARTLGMMGPVAASAVPALANLLTNGNSYTRVWGAGAIWHITSNESLSLPILIADMPTFNPYSKGLPAELLKEMGPRAKSAFPMLAAQFSRVQQQPSVLETISNALVAIDPEAAAKLFADKYNSKSTK